MLGKKSTTPLKKSPSQVKKVPHLWQQKYHFVKKAAKVPVHIAIFIIVIELTHSKTIMEHYRNILLKSSHNQ